MRSGCVPVHVNKKLFPSSALRKLRHTVEVMSDEHTSHTYLIPPSVPRVPVFFLMTPMMPV